MLSPEDRKLYTSCFRPPEGHVFEAGVGTTFTLDLETLFFVPLALTGSSIEDPRNALGDPPAVLEAIHRVSEKLTVFCQDGHSNAPSSTEPLFSLLESCFIPARARGDGAIFHPKLWLFRFRNEETNASLIRAVVLSRNATGSRCWDSMVQLEGTAYARERVKESRGLGLLIRKLPELQSQNRLLSADRRALLESLADEAERTRFMAPAPFNTGSAVAFLALGLGDAQQWAPSPGNRVLGISPFISPSALQKLSGSAKQKILISRDETLDACERHGLKGWECFSLRDGAGAEGEVAETEEARLSADSLPHGLHAKALVVEDGKKTTWWLGSANLTDPAISGSHVELLVTLEGATKHVGIDRFLEGFQAFLRPFDPSTPLPEPPPEAGARALAQQVQHDIVRSDLVVECAAHENSWTSTIAGHLRVRDGATVEMWPLTLGGGRGQRWKGESLVFAGLSPEQLTAFVAFRVVAKVDDAEVSETFTRRLPASGFPPERVERIVRSVVSDRNKLLSYLSRLLGDDFEIAAPSSDRRGSRPGNASATRSLQSPVLLESLLRALRKSPERLIAFDRMLERLGEATSDNGESIVPPELAELWGIVRELVPGRDGA